jgi:2-isopropylmalate synthase
MDQKWQYFQLLVDLGYKFIEVAFPCSSQSEYDFVRRLIETPGAVPADVTLQAISPCRKDALRRTVDCLRGAKKVILFTYISTSDNYRETIFDMSEEECLQRVTDCTVFARSITVDDPSASRDTEWTFGFGCEDSGRARPDVLLRLGEAVKAAWRPTVERPLIFGMATSVEVTTPNVVADQIEFFLTHITEREKIRLSVHPHNDRGCAVATAELACLAGADMVEGCLFGNGERAGNVDLVTLALNFFTQGIDPGINFSDLGKVRAVVEAITKIPVHPRAPYAGDFYFLALSGAHQDAIRKGFLRRDAEDSAICNGNRHVNGSPDVHGNSSLERKGRRWQVPYLPMDPADVGVGNANIIGINSQSGKSGILWVLQHTLGLHPPKELAIIYSQIIKHISIEQRRDLAADEICSLFLNTYHEVGFRDRNIAKLRHARDHNVVSIDTADMEKTITKEMGKEEEAVVQGIMVELSRALEVPLSCGQYSSHVVEKTAEVAAFVRCAMDNGAGSRELWGIGLGPDLSAAYISAVLSSITVGSFHIPFPFSTKFFWS